ncbi:MAG: GNAT family N-acetyltransferase [Oscillospiraceae bacterium]|nr:GNAT family N-acetyltransferase [Oscillospiraceae bacterium]
MNHKGTVTLETERLILRRFAVSDAADMYRNWASSAEVARFLTWEPHPSVVATAALLAEWVKEYEKPETYNWVLVLKASDMPVGNISVVEQRAETACASLGWCLGTAWWGQGYMPEAGNAVLRFLFESVGFNRVCANHDADNLKSGRVMQKIGMKKEGVLRQHGYAKGRVFDDVRYGILADEYRSMQHE